MVSEVSGGFKVLLKSAKKFEILIFNLFKGVLLEKWGFWWFLIKMVFQDQGGAFKVKTLSQIMIFEVRLRLFIFDDQGKLF